MQDKKIINRKLLSVRSIHKESHRFLKISMIFTWSSKTVRQMTTLAQT